MKLPELVIGDLIAKIPIIQGGMGVGVSLSNLAAAVANQGGIGIISGVQTGFREPDFYTNNLAANVRAIQKEIRKAKELAPKGIIGVNIMTVATQYKELVEAAVREKVDVIIAGSGLPKDLPKYVEGTKTKIIPVISSGKAAKIMSKLWTRNHGYLPDAMILEGPKAGGHLGFAKEVITEGKTTLSTLLKEVLEAVHPFEKEYEKKIPIIVAGGIREGEEIAQYLKEGASGVQISTVLVPTVECDAHQKFKEAYVNADPEDAVIVQSPVGLPGRAIQNKFLDRIDKGRIPPVRCTNCIVPCDPKDTLYCISDALIVSVTGDTDNGLIFCGSEVGKTKEITTVEQVLKRLISEAERVFA
ncbi:nitronate monooxygenase [Alkalibacter rhizosphaerae]|uniref:Probable nitronate monooxygenase n=1 Tax=Alkalibacter rhizosphaerae TaxID=2815577 RepID=A0A974XHT2_9FIRM|nr:nitronate monooxygenase family protein [Alkalibacter rhizosphaerae]QSX08985.1 nitronate monooxygenase [Alkalibacter rhizosphaerae]